MTAQTAPSGGVMTTEEPTIVQKLRAWPASYEHKDALSAGHVAALMEEAADTIEALSRTPPVDQDEVERVARAIYREQGSGRSFESIRHTSLGYQLFRYAIAAIKAMPASIGSGAGDVREALEVEKRYHELLFAVSKKYEGEDRHETALRYIREREADAALSTDTGSGG